MQNRIYIFIITGIIALFNLIGYSQTVKNNELPSDPDELFQIARSLAFEGKRDSARLLCRSILSKYENYHDVRILIGRTYSWDKKYDSARMELSKVLEKKKSHKDAINALIDVEKWSGNPDSAIYYCDLGLKTYPNDIDFLIKKAEILISQEKYEEARTILRQVLDIDPTNEEALKLLEKIKLSRLFNSVSLDYTFEYFENPYSRRWHLYTLRYTRKTKYGSFIFKTNIGDLISNNESIFDSVSWQFETDMYLKLWKKSVAYVNYGFSADDLFPRHRTGLEIYQILPKGIEVSLGGRFLEFVKDNGDITDVFIATGSLGVYYRSFWVSVRPFITPKDSLGTSRTFILEARNYLGSADNYIFVLFGTGNSPDELSSTRDVNIYRLGSTKAAIGFQHMFRSRLLLQMRFGYENEEFRKKNFRDVYNMKFRLSYLF